MVRCLLLFLLFVALPIEFSSGQTARSDPNVGNLIKENTFESVVVTPRVKFTANLSPVDAKPGETVTLTVKSEIEPGWHIGARNTNAGLPTKIALERRCLRSIDDDFTSSAQPKAVRVAGETELHHVGTFNWSRKYKVRKNRNGYSCSGAITFQVCDDSQCLPPSTVKFHLGVDGASDKRPVNIKHNPIGRPLVVSLDDCELSRPKVALSMLSLFSSQMPVDRLTLKGQIEVNGTMIDVLLPHRRRYRTVNTSNDETRFGNNATYLSIDHDGDGTIGDTESFACNRPIRIQDSMFRVIEIDKVNSKIVFQQVDAPLSGTILNRRCPEFEFMTLDGKTISDKSILGKVTILDIWAVT